MKMVALALVSLASAAHGQPSAGPSPDPESVVIGWRACIFDNIEKWSKQKEAADVVAAGAVGACSAFETRLASALRQPPASYDFEGATRDVNSYRERFTRIAVGQVLTVRARTTTP
jgi:hypothetical protein